MITTRISSDCHWDLEWPSPGPRITVTRTWVSSRELCPKEWPSLVLNLTDWPSPGPWVTVTGTLLWPRARRGGGGSGWRSPTAVQTAWRHWEEETQVHAVHTGVSWSASSMRPSLHGGVSLTANTRHTEIHHTNIIWQMMGHIRRHDVNRYSVMEIVSCNGLVIKRFSTSGIYYTCITISCSIVTTQKF